MPGRLGPREAPSETWRDQASQRELVVAAARVLAGPLVGVSAVLAGDDLRRGYWWLLLAFGLVVVLEYLAARRSLHGTALRQEWQLGRDALTGIALTAMACGVQSTTARLALLGLLAEGVFLLGPRAFAGFASLMLAGLATVSLLPHVDPPTAGSVLLGAWVAVVMVIVSVRVDHRDRQLHEMHRVRTRLLAEMGAAEERERARLAEALHDDAMQRIFAARQDLEEGVVAGDHETLAHASAGLTEALESLRALTKAMHTERLDDAGLVHAIDRVVADAARRGRFDAVVDVGADVTGDHDALLIGFVRGLVGNVEKHASARRVSVRIARDAGALVVEVVDDGRGMTAEDLERARAGGHLGHASLRDRVEALGGTLSVQSEPGHGTAVLIALREDRLRAHRALETQLERDREHLAALLAALQDGFLVVTDGRIVEVNERFTAMSGVPRDRLIGLPAADLVVFDDASSDTFVALLADVWSVAEASGELRLLGPTGEGLPVLVSARIARDGRGRIVGTMVTFKDVSDLRRQQDINDALIHAFRAPLALVDERSVLRVNRELCAVTGYSAAELEGRDLPLPFVPAEGVDAFTDAMHCLGRDGFVSAQLPVARKHGEVMWMSLLGRVLRGTEGDEIGRVLVMRDVHDIGPLVPDLPGLHNVPAPRPRFPERDPQLN